MSKYQIFFIAIYEPWSETRALIIITIVVEIPFLNKMNDYNKYLCIWDFISFGFSPQDFTINRKPRGVRKFLEPLWWINKIFFKANAWNLEKFTIYVPKNRLVFFISP